jgi:hypothetical protein
MRIERRIDWLKLSFGGVKGVRRGILSKLILGVYLGIYGQATLAFFHNKYLRIFAGFYYWVFASNFFDWFENYYL